MARSEERQKLNVNTHLMVHIQSGSKLGFHPLSGAEVQAGTAQLEARAVILRHSCVPSVAALSTLHQENHTLPRMHQQLTTEVAEVSMWHSSTSHCIVPTSPTRHASGHADTGACTTASRSASGAKPYCSLMFRPAVFATTQRATSSLPPATAAPSTVQCAYCKQNSDNTPLFGTGLAVKPNTAHVMLRVDATRAHEVLHNWNKAILGCQQDRGVMVRSLRTSEPTTCSRR